MNSFLENLYERAKSANKHIVLAEGFDKRVVKAAEIITKKGIAKVTVLGDNEEVSAVSDGIDLSGVNILDYKHSDKIDTYANKLYELRKHKGMTIEKAKELVSTSPLYFGAIMLKLGDCDGMVGGAVFSSGDVIRAALQIIKCAPGIKSVSSCFIMQLPETFKYCDDSAMVFSDCGAIPMPNDAQLADIAIASAKTASEIANLDPRVAMLSYSTKGSAKHEVIDKVTSALELVKAMDPELKVDGELQLDAAIVPAIASQKAPGSKVAGHANVLIFPDLEAGNIGYKIAQRFGNCEAYGPILQGLDKPINDLSRGCIAEEIVSVAAITAVQSIKE